ncbi:hypothetical protein ONE63_001074 [Megalurothrips usitatus]|uniref:Uncharacterized protein n=1 Tax=Megalurothrips usitatus TaxID=439358 RepID=A0AAV7XB25_9NEOP|nr:hypothetical protein ONE63_001074 [Megalurothrips usitatus]
MTKVHRCRLLRYSLVAQLRECNQFASNSQPVKMSRKRYNAYLEPSPAKRGRNNPSRGLPRTTAWRYKTGQIGGQQGQQQPEEFNPVEEPRQQAANDDVQENFETEQEANSASPPPEQRLSHERGSDPRESSSSERDQGSQPAADSASQGEVSQPNDSCTDDSFSELDEILDRELGSDISFNEMSVQSNHSREESEHARSSSSHISDVVSEPQDHDETSSSGDHDDSSQTEDAIGPSSENNDSFSELDHILDVSQLGSNTSLNDMSGECVVVDENNSEEEGERSSYTNSEISDPQDNVFPRPSSADENEMWMNDLFEENDRNNQEAPAENNQDHHNETHEDGMPGGELEYSKVSEVTCKSCQKVHCISDLNKCTFFIMFDLPLQIEVLLSQEGMLESLKNPLDLKNDEQPRVMKDVYDAEMYQKFIDFVRSLNLNVIVCAVVLMHQLDLVCKESGNTVVLIHAIGVYIHLRTAVLEIPTMNIVDGMVLEYFHAAAHGVTKWFVDAWLGDYGADVPFYFGKPENKKKLDKLLMSIHLPVEARKGARPISDVGNWTGRDYENFFLYLSVVVLTDVLPRRYLQHWSLFVQGMHFLLQAEVTEYYLLEGGRLLKEFGCMTSDLYPENFMTYNLHIVSFHLAENCKRWGPLFAINGYSFEDGNRIVKSKIHASKGIASQVCRSYSQSQALEILRAHVGSASSKKFQNDIEKKAVASCIYVGGDKYFSGIKQKTFSPTLQESFLFNQKSVDVSSFILVTKLVHQGCVYTPFKVQSTRTSNSIALLKNRDIVLIDKIIVSETLSEGYLIARKVRCAPYSVMPGVRPNEAFLQKISGFHAESVIISPLELSIVCARLTVPHGDFLIKVPNMYNTS